MKNLKIAVTEKLDELLNHRCPSCGGETDQAEDNLKCQICGLKLTVTTRKDQIFAAILVGTGIGLIISGFIMILFA